jgi:hypothetical protein
MEEFLHNIFFIELESLRYDLYGQTIKDPQMDEPIVIPGIERNANNCVFNYFEEVADVYYRLQQSFEDLTLSLDLLKLFNSDYLQHNKINKVQYVNYHIKIWYIKLSTISDLTTKLIGTTYDLRIDQRFMDFRIIDSNKYINNFELKKHLKDLQKLTESSIRNQIIHHQNYRNENLENFTYLELIYLFEMSVNPQEESEFNKTVNYEIDRFIEKTNAYLNQLILILYNLSKVFKKTCEEKILYKTN